MKGKPKLTISDHFSSLEESRINRTKQLPLLSFDSNRGTQAMLAFASSISQFLI
jgi:hypothetical protein